MAIVGASSAGCVTSPSQTYRSRYEQVETGANRSSTFTNLAEVGIQDNLGPDLEYRLADRLIHSDRTTKQPGVPDVDTTSVLHNPSFDVRTTVGTITWDQGFEVEEDRMDSTGSPTNSTKRTDFLQRVMIQPEEGLPSVTTWVDYRTLEDDRFFEQRTLEGVLEAEQVIGPFSWEQSLQSEELDDEAADSETLRREYSVRGSYDDDHLDGRLSTNLSVFLSERDTSLRFPAAVGGALPQLPVAGLSVVDATPQISMLADNPALIDGNRGTSAGINVGGFTGGGQINWNLGADLGLPTDVDEIRVYTVDPVDPLFVGDFRFAVYSSANNDFWDLVTSSASFVYEEPERRFRITIPRASDRYIKVVVTATPAAAPAVLVSEVELFARTGGGASGTTRVDFDDSVRSATAGAIWRLADTFTLQWNAFAQRFESRQEENRTRDEERLDTGLTASWSPHPRFDVSMRAEESWRRDDVNALGNEDFRVLSALATLRPLDTLDLSLNATRTDRDIRGEDDLTTDVAQASASAQLLDTLQADVSVEVSTQEDATNARDVDRTVFTAALFAELTPQIDLTLAARDEDGERSGPGAGGIPDPSEERYEIVLLYRPRGQLTAQAQVEWVDTFAGSGVDQRYRLDWVPFRDGAVNLQLDYDRTDVGSVAGERTDRYRALARWTINPSAFLELNWGTEVPEFSPRTDLASVSLNVSL